MKKMGIIIGISALGVGVGFGSTASAAKPDCNWGTLTAESIAGGFDQGGHASGQANPRVGLANVVEKGNLAATCELIEGAP